MSTVARAYSWGSGNRGYASLRFTFYAFYQAPNFVSESNNRHLCIITTFADFTETEDLFYHLPNFTKPDIITAHTYFPSECPTSKVEAY